MSTAARGPARLAAVAGLLALLVASAASAEERPGAPSAPEPAGKAPDAEERATPRGAMQGYLDACREGRFSEAASFLDLGFLPAPERSTEGPQLARHFKVVLDRTLWVDLDKLSDQPTGDPDDGLPPGIDRAGVVSSRKAPVEVLLKRMPGPSGTPVWEVARSTVRRIPALYAEFGYGVLGEYLPDWCFEIRFLEVELWQWVGLALSAILAWLLALAIATLARRLAQPIVRRTKTELDDRIVALMIGPARLAAALVVFVAAAALLKLSVPVHRFLGVVEKGLSVVVGTWVLMRLTHVATDLLTESLEKQGKTSVVAMMPVARKVAKAALIVMAAVGVLQSVGFNVTGLVAGLGVGGLAVALAAQKTVENLFGGATLAADQPVRVGDFCRFGEKIGTVEDIGLRSTRIRTLDRTVVTVPNSTFSQMEIENFGRRDRIRLYTTIGLRYETSPDQLRSVLAEVRKLLVAHPAIHPDPARIRFVGFGASSLDLEIFAYVRTTDFNEFLKVREDVFLRIMDIVEASGTGFAFPSQTVYFGRDSGLDPAKTRAAEAAVRAWRESGELPFPDLPHEVVAEIEDRLDYPPKGSAVAR